MSQLIIIVALLLPFVTIVFNSIYLKRQGKGFIGFAALTLGLSFLALLMVSILNLEDEFLIRSLILLAILCVCGGVVLVSHSTGKKKAEPAPNGKPKGFRKKPLLMALIAVPLAIVVGIFGYGQFLLYQIYNGDNMAQKISSYEKYVSYASWKSEEKAAGRLFGDLHGQCPDLIAFSRLSPEDRLLYYNFLCTYKTGAVSYLLEDDIHDNLGLENMLTLLETARQSENRAALNLPFTIPLPFLPAYNTEADAAKVVYQPASHYLLLTYTEANESLKVGSGFFLDASSIVESLPKGRLAAKADEIDYAVVTATYFNATASYIGGIVGYSQLVTVSVYDYKTGELMGLLGAFRSEPPDKIQRPQGSTSPEVAPQPYGVDECIKEFFKV